MLKPIIPQRVNEFIKENQKYITFFIKFLLAGGLLYFLLVKLDFREVYNLFLNVDPFYLSFATLLVIVNIGLRCVKWQIVSRSFFPEITTKEIIASFFYGIVGYLSIPLSVGEFVGRTTVLKKFGTIKVVVATAIDNYLSLSVLIFLGFFSLSYFLYNTLILNFYSFIIIVLFFLCIVILLIWFFIKKTIVIKILQNKFGKNKFIAKIKTYLKMIYELDNIVLTKVLLISFINTFTYITQYVLLMLAFGAELSILNLYWIALLIMFCKALIPPITLGELGIREGVAVYFAKSFSMSTSIAFNAAFSIFIINIIIPAVVGLFFVFRKSK